jgi:hypothetical protein
MTNPLPFAVVILLLLNIAASSALAEQTLRWNFAPGDQWQVEFDQQSEVTTTIAGRPTSMTLATGMQVRWQVASVDERGSAVVTQTFERLRMKLELPKTGVVEYDSASDMQAGVDARAIADAVAPLLKAEMRFTMSPRGEIVSVDFDEHAEQALEKAQAARSAAAPAMQSLYTKEGMANLLRQVAVQLPEDPVSPGDKWTTAATLKTPLGDVEQHTTYTLDDPPADQPQIARIESVTSLKLSDDPKVQRVSTLRDQEQRGVLLFDVEAGYLLSAEVTQRLATSSAVKDTPVQVRMTSTQKMSAEKTAH